MRRIGELPSRSWHERVRDGVTDCRPRVRPHAAAARLPSPCDALNVLLRSLGAASRDLGLGVAPRFADHVVDRLFVPGVRPFTIGGRSSGRPSPWSLPVAGDRWRGLDPARATSGSRLPRIQALATSAGDDEYRHARRRRSLGWSPCSTRPGSAVTGGERRGPEPPPAAEKPNMRSWPASFVRTPSTGGAFRWTPGCGRAAHRLRRRVRWAGRSRTSRELRRDRRLHRRARRRAAPATTVVDRSAEPDLRRLWWYFTRNPSPIGAAVGCAPGALRASACPTTRVTGRRHGRTVRARREPGLRPERQALRTARRHYAHEHLVSCVAAGGGASRRDPSRPLVRRTGQRTPTRPPRWRVQTIRDYPSLSISFVDERDEGSYDGRLSGTTTNIIAG
jgi:hypothetical protein